jgi:hypothetical protein
MNSDVHNTWPFVTFAPFKEPQVHNDDEKRACPALGPPTPIHRFGPTKSFMIIVPGTPQCFFECDRLLVDFLAMWPTIGTIKKEG